MHFHFIESRETLFTLNCMSRYTLVPVCHRWLCLVGVILSVPEGRAEFTWRSCTNHGCKLNTAMGWGRPRGTCLPVIFRHWVHLWVGVLSIFLCQEAGSAFAICCHPVPYGEPSGKVANPSLAYVIHRAWFGCGFSLHFHKAIWHLQLCWQRNVLRMLVRKCKKQKIFSQLFSRASLPSLRRRPRGFHSSIGTGNESSCFPPKGPKRTNFHSRNKKAWLAWARARAVDMPAYPPTSLLSSVADPSAFASLLCWILLAWGFLHKTEKWSNVWGVSYICMAA